MPGETRRLAEGSDEAHEDEPSTDPDEEPSEDVVWEVLESDPYEGSSDKRRPAECIAASGIVPAHSAHVASPALSAQGVVEPGGCTWSPAGSTARRIQVAF